VDREIDDVPLLHQGDSLKRVPLAALLRDALEDLVGQASRDERAPCASRSGA
jgi:hypothetical protein